MWLQPWILTKIQKFWGFQWGNEVDNSFISKSNNQRIDETVARF